MKVGTDGVLLGAWAEVNSCRTILDVGTGTGLIALMLAQRSNARIDAIEIDQDAFLQAKDNVASSPFDDRIHIYNKAFDDFVKFGTLHTYDLIVSNPPYFIRSLVSTDNKRNAARHSDSLSFYNIVNQGRKLLTPDGRIALILPYDQLKELTTHIKQNQMHLVRQTTIYSRPNTLPKRFLIEISFKTADVFISDDLIIEQSRHVYTDPYRDLTKNFYLF